MDLVSGVDHPESHFSRKMNRKLVWFESEVVGTGDLDHTVGLGGIGLRELNPCGLRAAGAGRCQKPRSVRAIAIAPVNSTNRRIGTAKLCGALMFERAWIATAIR